MIRGTRVNLVRVAPVHKERTRAWTNDPEIARLMDRPRPVSEAEHDAYFETIMGGDSAFFAVELVETGTHAGNVWLRNVDTRRRSAELSVVIGDAAARGKGAGSEAIDLLCRHAFEHLQLHRIYAYVLATNPGAKRAFEAAGFTQEGVLRDDRWDGDRFVDTYLLARLAGD